MNTQFKGSNAQRNEAWKKNSTIKESCYLHRHLTYNKHFFFFLYHFQNIQMILFKAYPKVSLQQEDVEAAQPLPAVADSVASRMDQKKPMSHSCIKL